MSAIINEAFHECGHAIAADTLSLPLDRVSVAEHMHDRIVVLPRSGALGWTSLLMAGGLAHSYHSGNGMTDAAVWSDVEQLDPLLRRYSITSYEAKACAEVAREVVTDRWCDIATIAGALAFRKTMSAGDITKLLRITTRRGAVWVNR